MGTILRAAVSVALLAACNSAPAVSADASADVQAVDTPAVTDAPDVPTVTDAPDVPAVTDAPDVPTVTDAPDVPTVTDAATDASQDVLVNGCPSLRDPVASADAGVDGGADTWNTYARGFFMQWCTRCHTSTITDPSDRFGAPAGFDWDQEPSVRMRLAAIRGQVGVLNAMPFNAPLPTCEERRRIVAWIDRGAP